MRASGRAVLLSLLVGFMFVARPARSARILAVLPDYSASHQAVGRALTTELARRGHQLVVITSNPTRDSTSSNYTEIDFSSDYRKYFGGFDYVRLKMSGTSLHAAITTFVKFAARACEVMLSHEDVRSLYDPGNAREHFDLLLLEWINPCLIPLSTRFSAPVIAVTSLQPIPVLQDFFGNPNNPSYITNSVLPYTDKDRSLFQRTVATLFHIYSSICLYNSFLTEQDKIAKRYFGPKTPYVGDILSGSSMLFVNAIQGFHPPRPNVPSIVYINGFSIKPPKPLPEDIQQFLDGSPQEAIYFSLGSNVKSSHLPADTIAVFLQAFAEMPDHRVLWKFEADSLSLPGQPANVRLIKWAPQQDVLRHPKVKVFITQGGLQSIEEAIHAQVPMIGIPFFGDQDYNINLAKDKGVALGLEVNGLTKESLLAALKNIIQDKSFSENMARLSALVNDQITSPMERAVWWTEYVLRHKGAAHLRTAAVDMPWYSYLLLDVILFLLAAVVLAGVLLWLAARLLWCLARKLLLASPIKHKTN